MRQLVWSLAAVLACHTFGCGSSEPYEGASSSGNSGSSKKDAGTTTRDQSVDVGKGGDKAHDAGKVSTQPSGIAPDGCGAASFVPERVVPDMMIVLDSSGSMLTTTVDRWKPSVAAVKKLTTTYDKDVGFGLMTFPLANDKCGPGTVQVPIQMGMGTEIGKILDRTTPQGGTPTGQSLAATRAWFEDNPTGLPDTVAGPRYVLLVTDGQPTCPMGAGARVNDQDLQLAITELTALAKLDIKTFVVGYDAALDPQFSGVLGEFAKAGGTEKYYPVKDEQSLVQAFEAISAAVSTCKFKFDKNVSDPSYIRVTVDGDELKMDDPQGWTYDEGSVVLTGEGCKMIQGREHHKVELALQCTPVH